MLTFLGCCPRRVCCYLSGLTASLVVFRPLVISMPHALQTKVRGNTGFRAQVHTGRQCDSPKLRPPHHPGLLACFPISLTTSLSGGVDRIVEEGLCECRLTWREQQSKNSLSIENLVTNRSPNCETSSHMHG